jgi:hypothetical protein
MVGQVLPPPMTVIPKNIFYKIFFNPVHGDISHDMGTPYPKTFVINIFSFTRIKKYL